MNSRHFSLVCLFLVLFLALTPAVTAVNVDLDVDLADKTLDVGDSLTVVINLENPSETKDTDIDVKIYVDSVLVYDDDWNDVALVEDVTWTRSISSSSFDNVWDDNLMDYDCGSHTLRVELSDDVDEEDEIDFDIEGEELSFSVDPSDPGIEDKITVTVLDEDDDELKGANVKFTHLEENEEWDDDDKYVTDDANTHGEVEIKPSTESRFKSDPQGKYQIDVWDGGYCKDTTTINVQYNLTIGDLEPLNPIAGENFKVQLTDGRGNGVYLVNVTISGPGTSPYTKRTDSSGWVYFNVDTAGDYVLYAAKTGYPDISKIVTVSSRSSTEISLNPSEPVVGEQVTINVKSSGSPLGGATIYMKQPDGSTNKLSGTTSSNGEITYTPTQVGYYTITASKARYSNISTTYQALNKFSVEKPSSDVCTVGNDVIITVRNQNGDPVANAAVSIQGTATTGYTDSNGRFTFTLQESKEYTLVIEKNSFKQETVTVSSQGAISLHLGSTQGEILEPLLVTVLDSSGTLTVATIRITKPDGTILSRVESNYSFTPEEPGTYTITALKENCADATTSIEVSPRSIALTTSFNGDRLNILASSHGEVVSGLKLTVTSPSSNTQEVVTDESGSATVITAETGDYVLAVGDSKYESTSAMVTKQSFLRRNLVWIILAILVIVVILIFLLTSGGLLFHHHRKKKKKRLTAQTEDDPYSGRRTHL